MLTDKKEIEIIQSAKQKNVRDPRRSREHFQRIIADFFQNLTLSGSYVDLGPGQFDFGELARQQGGTCLGVDFDPAVIELGQYKGFRTRQLNLKTLPLQTWEEEFDGVFNKFALNAYWAGNNTKAQEEMAQAIDALVLETGWAWIAPWNGVPKAQELSKREISQIIGKQQAAFEERGCSSITLSAEQAKYYGVNGTVANNIVFIKNLVFTG